MQFCLFRINMLKYAKNSNSEEEVYTYFTKSLSMELSPYFCICFRVPASICFCVPVERRTAVASQTVPLATFPLLLATSLACCRCKVCICCKVFRCCLLSLQSVAFATMYSMIPAIRQTLTAGSTRPTIFLFVTRFLLLSDFFIV